MKKVLAVLTSVALVLGLLPAQALAEALAEAGGLAAREAPVELGGDAGTTELGGAGATELGDAVPADAAAPADGAAIQEQQESSDAAATQPSGDDDATAAAQAASKGLNPSLTFVRYDEDSLTAYWALLFTAPGHGLKSFELTAELPSADVDGDGRADFRDELSGAPSVEGISPDVAFERGEGAFSLTFRGGLAENRIEKASRGGKSIKYPERPTTISFSTKVDPAWYASTGDAQDHTMSVKLVTTDSEGKPETFDLSATAQVENENWTCEHDNPGRYTVDDTERHTWHCGVCDYYEVHEHSFEGTGSSRTCVCGAEGARVSRSVRAAAPAPCRTCGRPGATCTRSPHAPSPHPRGCSSSPGR